MNSGRRLARLHEVTIQKGKTLFDLNQWKGAAPPPWAKADATLDARSVNANPIYVICFEVNAQDGLTRIGRFGPIEIGK